MMAATADTQPSPGHAADPPPAAHPFTPAPLASSFYTSHSSSLLLALSLLPLPDLAAAACVSRQWYELVARDSQQLAWRWQKHEERRKYRIDQPRHSQTARDSATAAVATADDDTAADAAERAAAAADRAAEASNVHLPFGPHAPLVEECRGVLLRATARAYFLRQGLGLLPREQQAAESPIYDSDTGLVRPAYSWPSETAPLPAPTPLLLHLRSLRLSLHTTFTPVYARFLTALPCLTSLGLVVTNLWPMDDEAVRDAMGSRGLGSKRVPLLSLDVQLMDLAVGDRSQRATPASSPSSSPNAAAAGSPNASSVSASWPFISSAAASGSSECVPAHLHANYHTLASAIPHLSSLRVLHLKGLTDALDESLQLSWLGDARGQPCFPLLVQLVLPRELSKTARRIYAVRTMLPSLRDLQWPDWGSLLNLTLMVGTAAREASWERAAGQRRRRQEAEAGEPPDRRQPSAASSYVPPPLRAPVPRLTCFALDGPLAERHLLAVQTLAPTLRKLVVRDTHASQSTLLLHGLAPFVDGVMRDEEEEEDEDRREEEQKQSGAPGSPSSPSDSVDGGGLEELSVSCVRWSPELLASLQSCGEWRRLRRLILSSSSSASADPPPLGHHHNLSVSNSSFQPTRFFQQFFVHSQLQQLTICGVALSTLACIANAAWAHSSVLHSLTLERVSEFSPRSLRQLLHLRRSLRHLSLIEVDGLCVEDLIELLPHQSTQPDAHANSNSNAAEAGAAPPLAGGLHPSGGGDADAVGRLRHHPCSGGLRLDSFHFGLPSARRERGDTYLLWRYNQQLRSHTRGAADHPIMQEPFATDEERQMPIDQLPTRECINAWSVGMLRRWRERMDECADELGTRECGPQPRIQVWFKALATRAARRPEWQPLPAASTQQEQE